MAQLVEQLDPEKVAANLAEISGRIASAAAVSGRDPSAVQILAATKYLASDQLDVLAQLGLKLMGENRAQALVEKASQFPGVFRWDFIGQLQSRKVKVIAPYVELIHSVASLSALRQLEIHKTDRIKVLLEVNVSGEEGKAGIQPDEISTYIESCPAPVVGFMTMPPLALDPGENRRYFAALADLADRHGLSELSMGTSQDYAVAIEEGATIVRLGNVLYR